MVTAETSMTWKMLYYFAETSLNWTISFFSEVLSILISFYYTLAFAAVVFNVLKCICKILGIRTLSRFCEGPTSYSAQGKQVVVATQMFQETTFAQAQRTDWYSVSEISYRIGLAWTAFIFALLFHPFTLIRYTFMYNKTFYGKTRAVFSVFLLPFLPVIIFLGTFIYDSNSDFLSELKLREDELESMRFFTNRLRQPASFLYSYSQDLHDYVGNFYILGPCKEAILTMRWDTDKSDKVFWRKQLSDQGARVPREVGSWDGKTLEWKEDLKKYNYVVVKVIDSCMGIGDMFLKRNRDYNSTQDIEQIFHDKYQSKPSLLIEFVTAHPNLGVHSLDILTARDPAGEVQLIDVLVWAGSASDSSHGATDCYMMDPRSEVTCNTGKWYNPNFANTSPAGLSKHYPGVSGAVITVLQAHKKLPISWLNVVGWDCMVTEQADIVFFEGNLANGRCPRRLFLSLGNLIYFMSYISWVAQN